MDYSIQLLEKILAGKLIGNKIYFYQETDSTNDEAYQLGTSGSPEGTVVIADSQTKGKGRLHRVWYSPAGINIYTSIILRPDLKPELAPQISILAGVAVAEALDNYCAGRVELKWPNDVLLNGKKVCGILAYMKTSLNKVDFIVLGVGINVNISNNQFPHDIRGIATSLAIETGRKISRQELIISLYENLAKWYKKGIDDGFNSVKEKWLSLTPMIGKNVQVKSQDEVISGKAVGINESGSLTILTAKGGKINISAGDATILKEK